MDALAGLGLATSSGLNAYIPLLTMAIMARFTDQVELPAGFEWMGKGWVLIVLVVLLAIEVVVDKVPGLDHANDAIQTIVRPASGAVVFAAQTTDGRLDRSAIVPLIAGAVLAFLTHGTKATARGAANAGTVGFAAPVLSVIEDIMAIVGSIVAIVFPILVVFFLGFVGWLMWKGARWRRRRRAPAAELT